MPTAAPAAKPTGRATRFFTLSAAASGLLACLSGLMGCAIVHGAETIPMAFTAGATFFLLALGLVLLAGASSWPLALLAGATVRARLLRAFMPVMAGAVLAAGWMASAAFLRPWGSPVTFVAATAFMVTCVMGWTAVSIARRVAGAIEQAELAQRQDHEISQILIHGMNDHAVFMLDTQGQVSSWNAGAERLMGYTAEEAAGQHFSRFYPAKGVDARGPEVALHAAADAGKLEEEGWCIRKNGSQFWARVTMTALRDGQGPLRGFAVYTRDISEKKEAEDRRIRQARNTELRAAVSLALAQERELGRVLQITTESMVRHLDAAFARIWLLNREENVLELKASAGMYTHLDGPHGRVPVGKLKIGLIAEEKKPHLTNDVPNDPRVSDKEWARAKAMIAFAGYPLISNNQVIGVMALFAQTPFHPETLDGLASFADALAQGVQRKQADDARLQAEASFRALMEQSPDPVAIHHPQGQILYVNKSLARTFGYDSPESLVGKPLLEMIHPTRREEMQARLHSITSTDAPEPVREVQALHRAGHVIDVEVLALPVVYDGEPVTLVLMKDVSERKQLTAKMMQVDRMIAVGTLAAGVGHEINNPLAYIIANLDFVKNELPEIISGQRQLASEAQASAATNKLTEYTGRLAELQEILGEVGQGAERVRDVVRDLRTFSRGDDTSVTAVDVKRVIEASINMAKSEIRHRAQVIREYGEVPLVRANESRLGQVFLNLLVNAAHAIPEGSVDRNELRVRTYTKSGRVFIDVQDTGSGIPPENLSRIFLPFFTTKPVGQGTGLGLAICQGIVLSLGGELTVQSRVGTGSTFTVALPPATPTPSEAAVQSPAVVAGERARILFVDDESMLGKAVQRLLDKEHDVVQCLSAREALQRLREGEDFDLLYCDLMMPDMTGMDFFEHLGREFPKLTQRVVFMTGGAFTPAARDFLDHIPNERLQKPFSIETLRQQIAARKDRSPPSRNPRVPAP